ncbi:MAG TPA: c-type cytochrome, partial [Steroidobacteraceae bacterium]|nr:c-type cytochrome [Steroidobacteraceae bacterium]
MRKTMKVASVGSIVLAALLASAAIPAEEAAAPAAGGSVESGATKAAVCGACHGQTGSSVNPEWPNLAGQSGLYIEEQLHLFKSNVRSN